MSVAEPQLPIATPAPVRAAAWWEIAAPVVIVALALMAVVGGQIAHDHGNLTGLVCFGPHFAATTRPPAGALPCGIRGYDGQFFYLLARDPWIGHVATLHALQGVGGAFRAERLGYPLLVFLASAGQVSAVPAALLAVNVVTLLALTAWLAAALRRRGHSALWATAVALSPGMLLPVLRDLSDPLATACVLVGVLAWQERRRRTATLALALAVLTREVSIAVVVALAGETALRAWQGRQVRGRSRAVIAQAWPVLVIPAAVFAAWQLYVAVRNGGVPGTAPAGIPLLNLVHEAASSLRDGPPAVGACDTVYIALVCAAIVLAVRSAIQRVTPTSAAACALCLSIALPTLGDFWGDTRLSAPLLAMLLLDGLRRRDRASIAVATAAGAMTLLILPFG